MPSLEGSSPRKRNPLRRSIALRCVLKGERSYELSDLDLGVTRDVWGLMGSHQRPCTRRSVFYRSSISSCRRIPCLPIPANSSQKVVDRLCLVWASWHLCAFEVRGFEFECLGLMTWLGFGSPGCVASKPWERLALFWTEFLRGPPFRADNI